MTGPYESLIVRFAARVQAPLLQLYALYIVFHGHYSPGGGFQAGAALAASFLIPRIVEGSSAARRGMTTRRATSFAIAGVAIFLTLGILPLLYGESFLDYSALELLPWPMPHGAATRAIGTLGIEIGVTLAVMGVMITLYDDLVAEPRPGV